MSMSFDPELNPEMQKQFKKFMEGEGIATVDDQDGRTALLSELAPVVDHRMMKILTQQTGSNISLNINSLGDKKTVGDVDYIYTVNGWIRQPIRS